ncbi:MAG TPA: zinc-binding dehydrogenase [Candidatus Limnocylindrales bacterium]|nr:zinc-binding dehydrogenase [Candidatus Limnocylindrales bacterium]
MGLCERTADGAFSPGPMLGFCSDLPGGWSDELVAHASQLHAVPDGLGDEVAVLVEPLSVALHAVLAAPPKAGERVLVIGGGTLGLCVVAALRMVAIGAEVTIAVRHRAQREMAERLGAGAVAADAVDAAVEHAGARRFRPPVGDDVLVGGFDQVYDCVGSEDSLDAALRTARPRGRVVVPGGPGRIGGLDWTLVWTRELAISGSYVYGREDNLEGAPHTIDAAMRMLAEHPELPVGELVTHRFGLDQWRAAMGAALDRRGSGALKIAFQPQG